MLEHLTQPVAIFSYLLFLLLGVCARALAAAVLLALEVLPSRRTLEAALAARALVCLLFATISPLFCCVFVKSGTTSVLINDYTINCREKKVVPQNIVEQKTDYSKHRMKRSGGNAADDTGL